MITISDAELQALLTGFLWPFLRVAAMIQTAPFFGHPTIPRRVKVALAVLISIVIAPLVEVPAIDPFSGAGLLALLQQFIVGAVIGYSLRIVFAAFELAGDLIGLQMGLGFASFIDPARNAPSPLLATFLIFTATVALVASNGHLVLIQTLVESFVAIPVSAQPLAGLDWGKLAGLGVVLFAAGIQIALPVLAAVLALNIGMGFISRSAPQLSVFSVGFAFTLLGGMVMLFVAILAMAGPMEQITGLKVPYAVGR
jgi:flagellar biosynthetic protein FliR